MNGREEEHAGTMNGVARWLKFNVVGAAGMAVQLGTLAALNHAAPGHYLLMSGIAVEAAVLHNFIAHRQYTWRDRRDAMHVAGSLLRFQISNGAVSLLGTVVLMRLLVSGAHVPVLAANCISIAVCGLVNFWLGDSWAFAVRGGPDAEARSDSIDAA